SRMWRSSCPVRSTDWRPSPGNGTPPRVLLAVWHNHRVFTCGVHTGMRPVHVRGRSAAPTDWLVALGYRSAEALVVPAAATDTIALAA
ncbi:MAG: hypothetical protein M3R61_07825, partial [Chloroflexota bacterium]|nr:hypothetical protein [Chloroflexota bacterium]